MVDLHTVRIGWRAQTRVEEVLGSASYLGE